MKRLILVVLIALTSLGLTVGVQAQQPVDVYLIVDLSGSFADDLPGFKTQASSMISAMLSANPNTRFGLARFEDYPIPPFGYETSGDKAYERVIDLTFDSDAVLSAINALTTRYGGDGPQSQLPALYQAATGEGQDLSGVGQPQASIPAGQQANFRCDAVKLFILWTDAEFHLPGDPGLIPYPGPSFEATAAALNAGGASACGPIQIKAIGISSGGGGYDDLAAMAAATGAVAPAGGVDIDGDGTVDIPEGGPLVASLSSSGEGVGAAIAALVAAASGPIPVNIDIKPGSDPNSINLKNQGEIPVAVLSTPDFDASSVDPLTCKFGPGEATESHGRGHLEDVDLDGDVDLVLHFLTQESGIACDATEAELLGATYDGKTIKGADEVRIVKCLSKSAETLKDAPLKFVLEQNYPNPFNPETEIRFHLPDAGYVVIIVFDVTGREVRRLTDLNLEAGSHSVRFDGLDATGAALASGVYIYQLRAGIASQTRRMILMR